MNESRLIDLLNSLIQVDLDASRAYGQALENTFNSEVHAQLSAFLRAMRLNELLTNKRYTDALAADLPPEVREIIARNQADERRHFDFIEQAIVRPAMV